MVYEFDNQNSVGKNGELIVKNWLLKQINVVNVFDVSFDKKYQDVDVDLIVLYQNGDKITYEVKTDTFLTGNLFFETVSNINKASLGCMMYTGADYILYFFIKNNDLYKLPTNEFRNWVLSNKEKFKEKIVKNKHYHSKGLLIPLVMIENKFGNPLKINY